MHEGYNARTWAYVKVASDLSLNPQQVEFLAGLKGLVPPGQPFVEIETVRDFAAGSYEVFEAIVSNPAKAIPLYGAHNEIRFYTWGDRECCLPIGATHATLIDEWVKTSTPPQQPDKGKEQQADGQNKGREQQAYVQGKGQAPLYGSGEQGQPHRALNLHVGDFLLQLRLDALFLFPEPIVKLIGYQAYRVATVEGQVLVGLKISVSPSERMPPNP